MVRGFSRNQESAEFPCHARSAAEVTSHFETDPRRGLTERQVEGRQSVFGLNQLPQAARAGPISIFFSQFGDFMVLVLMGAAAVSSFLGEMEDAVVIMAIVILNALLGFAQEYRAERSLETLQKLAAPQASIRRNGRELRVPASGLVPGDIMLLREGDRVPADGRLLEAYQMAAGEAALTGESQPVEKDTGTLPERTVLGDRANMVFQGTSLVRGRGIAVVVATGVQTQMGSIAGMIQQAGREQTPLQARLARLGVVLVALCAAVVALVVVTGLLRGEEPYLMLMAGISLAVAAIPEGLPAVVTITLALGVQRMIRVNAIIRRLPAVETLGCATTICSDKTGTLTENRMSLAAVWAQGQLWERTRSGRGKPGREHGLVVALGGAASDAPIDGGDIGDPTETALVSGARALGREREVVQLREARAREIPFDSSRKRMTVMAEYQGHPIIVTKGAPEIVLDLCSAWEAAGGQRQISARDRRSIVRAYSDMAERGYRVLAVATGEGAPDQPLEGQERDLILKGMIGLVDPPRPEVKEAISTCRKAGLVPIMITGDHRLTAVSVAREIGLAVGDEEEVLTGEEMDGRSEVWLANRISRVRVFARVSPQHKIRIVRALKSRGQVVAMTGDGVNDAPAVKEAHIGIAMGRTGTDVTREAADMILTDDNFASIVAAVREGRGIYDNIRKFLRYLLACNLGEVLVMLWAGLLGYPLPLLPIQILLVNLVTDGLPAVALAVDPAADDVMARPPRHPREGVFSRGLRGKIVSRGVFIGLVTLLGFVGGLHLTQDAAEARTMALAVLVMSQLVHVFECRSETLPVFALSPLTNPLLLVSVAMSGAILWSVIYVEPLSRVFRTHPLSGTDWIVVGLLSALAVLAAGLRSIWPRPLAERRAG